jgi:hypothetical protein
VRHFNAMDVVSYGKKGGEFIMAEKETRTEDRADKPEDVPIQTEEWRMSVEEFQGNGCLINSD